MKKIKNLNLPTHIAIIMDGNGRWAKRRALPRSAGHKEGSRRLVNLTLFANEIGLKYLTVYAFSTENWSRPQDEVDYLMRLPLEFLNEYKNRLYNENIKLQVIGDKGKLPLELQEKILEVEEKTSDRTGLTFVIALNYGSKIEIFEAAKQLSKDVLANKVDIETLESSDFNRYLFTKGIPDVDLLIRTSNELRISNFLLWQIAYSELYFTKVLWPDFKEKQFIKAIKAYNKRNRRFGKVGV